MGGGVGVSVNASHMVVGERFLFAMPEVGIGFFPDVGATYFLPRLPHRFGAYFALTGLRAKAGDAVAVGLARTFAPSDRFPALAEALERDAPVEETLARFAAPPPPSALMKEADAIEAAFAGASREAILAALEEAEASGASFAGPARAAMLEKSPTSQAIALRQVTIGGALDFPEAMRTEYRIVSRIALDTTSTKAFAPSSSTRTIARNGRRPRTPEEVDAYFAPLGADELQVPSGA